MTKIIVDGKEIDVPPEYTLLQACEAAGAEIPRFCFHERLSIAGNCRMCLIEVVGIPKPQASCAMGVKDLPANKDGSPDRRFNGNRQIPVARYGKLSIESGNGLREEWLASNADAALVFGRAWTDLAASIQRAQA